MKVAVFNLREDEREFFEKYSKEYGQEIVEISVEPYLSNVELVEGCDCMSITTNSHITKEMVEAYARLGLKFISTRTIGYEHMDLEAGARYGVKMANIGYSPSSVADYAIMMMLMVLRKMKSIMYRSLGQDYAVSQNRGRELPSMTVGIIGTGKIGATVARHLTGFGCRILAYDPFKKESLKDIVEYVALEQLYASSDIITLHVPDTEESFHMINAESIRNMKDGVILINTARGTLVDTGALIDALESGKVGGAALDVVENDRYIYYRDQKGVLLKNREMAILEHMPNVLMSPHMAFYTEEAVSDMVRNSLLSCKNFMEGKPYEGKLN